MEGHYAGEGSLGTHEFPVGSFGPTCWSGDTAMGVTSVHHGLQAAYELGQG